MNMQEDNQTKKWIISTLLELRKSKDDITIAKFYKRIFPYILVYIMPLWRNPI